MSVNTGWVDAYVKLLILQYSQEPKAEGDIRAKLTHFSKIFDIVNRWFDEFDLDQATGDRLDKIGDVVQMPRVIPAVVPKQYFGFSDNVLSTGFGDRFIPATAPLFPFKERGEPDVSDTTLNDADFRNFIRAKIAKNTASATISDADGRIGLQNAVQLFDAVVVDNYDMTITYYIDSSVDQTRLNIISSLGLLPSPMAVGSSIIINYSKTGTFGFSDNPNSVGFGLGTFASKVI